MEQQNWNKLYYKACQCNLLATWISSLWYIMWLRVICICVTRERGQWKPSETVISTSARQIHHVYSGPFFSVCVYVCVWGLHFLLCLTVCLCVCDCVHQAWFGQTVWPTGTLLFSALALNFNVIPFLTIHRPLSSLCDSLTDFTWALPHFGLCSECFLFPVFVAADIIICFTCDASNDWKRFIHKYPTWI